MKKLVLVINGRGGVGKDTLCAYAARRYRVQNISSITPIKELAKFCGWNGEKTDAARRFLAELKHAAVAYNDYPTRWVVRTYEEFLAGEDEILFVNIREAEEIQKFVAATGGRARTLLVRAPKRLPPHRYGNESDDLVEQYSYDLCFSNDKAPAVAGEEFLALLGGLLEDLPC